MLPHDGEVMGDVERREEGGKWKVERGKIFDLQGRRVQTSKKGIYIIDGHKVIK